MVQKIVWDRLNSYGLIFSNSVIFYNLFSNISSSQFLLCIFKLLLRKEQHCYNNIRIFFYMMATLLVLVRSEGSSVRQNRYQLLPSYLHPPVCTPERAPFLLNEVPLCV